MLGDKIAIKDRKEDNRQVQGAVVAWILLGRKK